MSLHRFLYIFYFLLLSFTSSAQHVPTHRYTTKDGMFTERVTCITQDKKGYMWFGTYFGVMRYDGYQFQKIGLPDEMKNKFVSCITAAGEKVYAGFWFGGGLMEWDKGKASKIPLPDKGYKDIYALITNNDGSISILAVKQGSETEFIILNYKNGKFHQLWKMDPAYKNITSIAQDESGRHWIGTQKGLLIRSECGHIKQYLKDTAILSITRNKDGTMVANCHETPDIIYFFGNAETGIQLKKRFSSNDIIFPKLNGNNQSGYWGYHPQKGLTHISGNTTSNYNFPLPPKTVIGDIFIDRENNIWLVTEAGLIKFNALNSQSYYFNERAPATGFILPLEKDKITTNGFTLFRLTNDKLDTLNAFYRTGVIGKLVLDSKKNIWISQWGGAEGVWRTRLQENKLVEKRFYGKYKGEAISGTEVKEDINGTIWIGGASGIFFYKNGRINQHYKTLTPKGSGQIISIVLDEKNKILWAAINAEGLLKYRYRVNNTGVYEFTFLDFIDEKKGIQDVFIRGNLLLDSKGSLWFGSRNAGLGRLTETSTGYTIKYFSEKEGITCSRVTCIKEYNNAIWVSTCDGVYKIEDTVVRAKYNTADGLLSNDVFSFVLENGHLVAATPEGITKIKLLDNQRPPPLIAISDVRILGVSDSSLYSNKKIKLSHQKNSIGFVFTANSYIDEKNVQYKYKLEGLDKDWSVPTTSNNINYASLPPGDYTFKVMAQNAKGTWSENPAVYSFYIVQPFYTSLWFICLAIVSLLLLVYVIRSYRIRQRLKIEKMRLSIARDLHDDIGSALGSINILSRTAQRRIKGDADSEMVVNKIGATAQKTLESMDEIIWTINPVKEKAIDLVVRMQNFAQPLLEAESIQFNFVSTVPDLQKLDMKLKRNFYLIFKELIHNAIKHSDCTEVHVELYIQHKWLVLDVKDNGIGINNLNNHDRNGLKNIKERAGLLSGELIINTAHGEGTHTIVKAITK